MNHVNEIEAYFECALPSPYKAFLKKHDQELKGDIYLYLPEDVIERNQCYETKKYADGYINIGDNGGGQAFVLLLLEKDPVVYLVDHASMDPDDKKSLNLVFSKWIKSELNLEY